VGTAPAYIEARAWNKKPEKVKTKHLKDVGLRIAEPVWPEISVPGEKRGEGN